MRNMRSVTAALATLAALAITAPPALGEAGTHASCMGIEASNLSPPGSTDEVPGGMPEFRQFIRENFPKPPGAVSAVFAHLHEGSHAACDEAVE
jgi:hypothetical protein